MNSALFFCLIISCFCFPSYASIWDHVSESIQSYYDEVMEWFQARECKNNFDCDLDYPVCDKVKGRCTRCTLKKNLCMEPLKCNLSGKCVSCLSDNDCKNQVCDIDEGICVECKNDSHCKDPFKPICRDGCKSCEQDIDCKEGKKCVLGKGFCSECLNDSHCRRDLGMYCNNYNCSKIQIGEIFSNDIILLDQENYISFELLGPKDLPWNVLVDHKDIPVTKFDHNHTIKIGPLLEPTDMIKFNVSFWLLLGTYRNFPPISKSVTVTGFTQSSLSTWKSYVIALIIIFILYQNKKKEKRTCLLIQDSDLSFCISTFRTLLQEYFILEIINIRDFDPSKYVPKSNSLPTKQQNNLGEKDIVINLIHHNGRYNDGLNNLFSKMVSIFGKLFLRLTNLLDKKLVFWKVLKAGSSIPPKTSEKFSNGSPVPTKCFYYKADNSGHKALFQGEERNIRKETLELFESIKTRAKSSI